MVCTFPHCACQNDNDLPLCPEKQEPLDLAPYRLPVVIIPQHPTEMTPSGPARRQLDLSDAERYGRLVELVQPTAKPWDPEAVAEMADAVAGTSPDDWLLALGSPAMIALAAGQLACAHGRVNLLMYQSRSRRYEALTYVFSPGGTTVEVKTTNPEDEEN